MRNAVSALFGGKVPPPVQETLQRMLLLNRMSEVYDQANRIPNNRSICEKLMERLQVRPKIRPRI